MAAKTKTNCLWIGIGEKVVINMTYTKGQTTGVMLVVMSQVIELVRETRITIVLSDR